MLAVIGFIIVLGIIAALLLPLIATDGERT
jgi:hypothetical protein